MSAIAPFVSFCLPMAQKEQTIQLGTRIKTSIKKRAEDFCVRHPLQPSLTTVVERALTEWLDLHEAELTTWTAARKPRGK